MRVTNGIPLGRSLLLPVHTVNCVQTLKVQNSISGHLFSRNIEGPWHVSPTEPYDNHVAFTDGTTQTFSTMERPKLMFDQKGTALWFEHDVAAPSCYLEFMPPLLSA